MKSKRMNVIFIDSRGTSAVYGIGSYRRSIVPELGRSKDINLICVTITYSDIGGVKVEPPESTGGYTNITLCFSYRDYQLLTGESANRTQMYVARICFTLIRQLIHVKGGIVHINSKGETELAEVAKEEGFSVVATQHILINGVGGAGQYSSYSTRQWMADLDRRYFSIVDGIIFLSEHTRRNAISLFGYPSQQTTLIYNGILPPDAPVDGLQRIALREQHAYAPDDFIVLYAGRIDRSKGVFDLIKAFTAFAKDKADVKLIVAGGSDYGSLLEAAFSCSGKIIVTGFLSAERLAVIYRIADVGVLPSHSEQSSYTVLEMFGHGLPVIVSDIEGFEVYEDGVHVLKTAFHGNGPKQAEVDITMLKDRLEAMYANRSIGAALAAASGSLVRQSLHASVMMEKTIGFYKHIMKNKKD